MKVLHVMKVLPYPPDNGFAADIWDRMLSMKRLGFRVHALVMAERDRPSLPVLEKLGSVVERLDIVERSPMFRSVMGLRPALIARNQSLAGIPLDEPYDLTLAESEHMIPIFDNPGLRTRFRVLRVHNNERKYMAELSKVDSNPFWKVFFGLESLRYGICGQRLLRNVDAVWFISQQESKEFTERFPGQAHKAHWLPPSVTLDDVADQPGRSDGQVLFVGGLKNALNREGLCWYLETVHPKLLTIPAYELVVAGSAKGSPQAGEFAREMAASPRVTVHSDLGDLTPLYRTCSVIINPMRRGSGVKLKSIHAVQNRRPLVTTSVGAEGSGLVDETHVKIADTPPSFASAVAELIGNPMLAAKMAREAYEFLQQRYDSDKNITSLVHPLMDSAPRPSVRCGAPEPERLSSRMYRSAELLEAGKVKKFEEGRSL